MNFYLGKGQRKALLIIALPLLVMGYYEFKKMTSVFNTDFGNGIVVYADDYVKSGNWVYDCGNTRLISRKPLAVPIAELEAAEKFTLRSAALSQADKKPAGEALQAVTSSPEWYKNLRYLYSGLNEFSNLSSPHFDMVAQHNGRAWAIQIVPNTAYGGNSNFWISARPYNPETYEDYAKALKRALTSCPVLQQEHLPITDSIKESVAYLSDHSFSRMASVKVKAF
jgi:hypothetical protein